ncbi:MAG TPA: sulfatase [Patescibacteria group bacterium]|nr:sulfatase [Patescibacteria group bacterium]
MPTNATWLGGTARTVWASAIVTATAGLIEGIALGVVYDPYDAGWMARGKSIAIFVAAYFVAGGIAGALIGSVMQWARLRGAAPAVACGLIGLIYFRAWGSSLKGIPMSMHPPAAVLALCGAILFALGGAVAARQAPRRLPGVVLFCGAMGVAMALLLAGSRTGSDAVEPAASAPVVTVVPVSKQYRTPSTPARNVLFVVADTLRADHLSLYGYARATSPGLERYARQGAFFAGAITQKTKTSPSVASLLTGTYPHTHGIVNCRTRLPNEVVTIAEALRERRFATHSIVANSNIGAAFNFNQGFESVDEIWSDPGQTDARGVTDHALKWLTERGATGDTRPFFLYVQYIDPHAPYAAPSPWTERFVDDSFYGRYSGIKVGLGGEAVGGIRPFVRLESRPTDVDYYVARYDAEIAYLDHHLERLLDGLKQLGLERDTLVIFTADHGEALSEHDVFFGHGGFTYEDTARVPLIITCPGRVPPGRVVDSIVETAGLAPTVMQALGIPPPGSMELRGFWDLAAGASPSPPATADEDLDGPAAFVEGDTVPSALRTAIRTRRWKLIENPTGFDRAAGRFDPWIVMSMNQKRKGLELVITRREFLSRWELYDLAADPGETANLAARRPDITGRLRARLLGWRAGAAGRERLLPSATEGMPDDVLKNLKSLGYVQ